MKIVFLNKFIFDNMNIPQDLKYTKDHEWVRVEGEEAVLV